MATDMRSDLLPGLMTVLRQLADAMASSAPPITRPLPSALIGCDRSPFPPKN